MEFTPQQLGDHRIETEIARQVGIHFPQTELDRMEASALEKHPPLFRSTVSVPEALRNVGVKMMLQKPRTPKRKQHVLP